MQVLSYEWTGKEDPKFYEQLSDSSELERFKIVGETVVRDALKKVFGSTLIPDVSPEATVVFQKVVNTLQIFPVPVYASPLRMLLEEALGLEKEGSRILLDSFDGNLFFFFFVFHLPICSLALRTLCTCEQIIANMANNPCRKKIEGLREKFIERIGAFSRLEGGLHKVFGTIVFRGEKTF